MEEENQPEKKKSGGLGCLWVIVGIIAVGWFINKLWSDYQNGEKDPFWKGTEVVQVCKTPYYSSKECHKLKVSLIDKKTAQIYFPNGGYKVVEELTCYYAASIYNTPKYVFCRSEDNEGQQWDLLPAWVNY